MKKISIVLFLIILCAGVYFLYTKFFYKKADASHVSANVISTNKNTVKRTYTNTRYGFSISYPCDNACQKLNSKPHPNAYADEQVNLPTRSQAYVTLSTITDAKVLDWNQTVDMGPGSPFPFDLESLKKATLLPVDSKCEVLSYDSKTNFSCKVVIIGGKKAVEFVNTVPKTSYLNRSYFINLSDNEWLQVMEIYFEVEYSNDFLSDPTKITPALKDELGATKEVVDTLKFK